MATHQFTSPPTDRTPEQRVAAMLEDSSEQDLFDHMATTAVDHLIEAFAALEELSVLSHRPGVCPTEALALVDEAISMITPDENSDGEASYPKPRGLNLVVDNTKPNPAPRRALR